MQAIDIWAVIQYCALQSEAVIHCSSLHVLVKFIISPEEESKTLFFSEAEQI